MADEIEVIPSEPIDPGTPGEEVATVAPTASYDWNEAFVETADMSGKLVGFENEDYDYDLSQTGVLERNGSRYEVVIQGYKLLVDETGTVYASVPAGSSYVGHPLKILNAEMQQNSAVGGAITRSEAEAGHTQEVNLTSMEPRDQFAVQALNAMLIHADHPESFDDAKMLFYSRSAYRWAQAMMIAAADSRHGQSTDPNPPAVSVNPDDLQSNTEKLLYNMADYMKRGVTVKGTTASGTEPVQMKVTEMPNVKVTNALDGNDDPIPLVTDINSAPAIEVKNPLDTNDEAIPLEVNSHAVTT